MPITKAEARRVLNYTLKGTAYVSGDIVTGGWLALATEPLTDEEPSPFSEAGFTGYARKQISFAAADTEGNTIKNDSAITFPPNTAGTSNIVAYAVMNADGSSGAGDIKYYTNLCTPVVHNAGESPLSFPVGSITIRLGCE